MSADAGRHGRLWVCWAKPDALPPGDVPILTFLPPSAEEDIQREHQGPVIFGREAALGVRSEARALYLDLVAKLGLVAREGGPTLRQALARPGEASRWWYHPVSFKDCESSPTFDWIIATLTIRAIAEKYGVGSVRLYGAPREVAAVLESVLAVEERRPAGSRLTWRTWFRGIASRARFAVVLLRQWLVVRTRVASPRASLDIVFSGFWDWSVRRDDRLDSLVDRYFGRLPEELRRRGLASIGWFAWFDPHNEPRTERRTIGDAVAPASGREDVVLLQGLLRPWDIARALSDFGPLVSFLRIGIRRLRRALEDGGIDYYPLFAQPLLRGFLDASLPYGELVSVATARACRRHRPRVTLSFQEHFPHARAHYEGVRRAGIGTMNVAVQHAIYGHEKTFLALHPRLEFGGEPDGCGVPHPDYVCAMGTLGRQLFLECGYGEHQVLSTGSPRYDHVAAGSPSAPEARGPRRTLNVLMVLTLNVTLELEMVDAVCAAARSLGDVTVRLRGHPFRRVEGDPRFAPYRASIELTTGPLVEDLDRADLVLCTYSTSAEEAFARGKPVWQWLPSGFNGSALAEVVPVPQFGSVAALRKGLLDFVAGPERFTPSPAMRRQVLDTLFGPGGDGDASTRISAIVSELAWPVRRP